MNTTEDVRTTQWLTKDVAAALFGLATTKATVGVVAERGNGKFQNLLSSKTQPDGPYSSVVIATS